MSFLKDLKKNLGGAADYTVKKTNEVTGAAKIRMDIRAQNARLAKCFERIGRAYYKKEKGIGELPEDIGALVAEADEIKEGEAKLRAQLARLQGCVICPACGAQISIKSVYCPLCGIKLPKDEPAAKEVPAEDTPAADAPAEETVAEAAPAADAPAEEQPSGAAEAADESDIR